MSIKHRTKDRMANGKIRPLFYGWDYRYHHDHKMEFVDYGKNPGWWNRLYNLKPKRQEARHLCRDIVDGLRDADEVLFPHCRKPNYYYW